MANAKLAKVTVKLPGIEGEWIADRAQQTAAWEMYVELVTRSTVQPLGPEDGLVSEALSSLYALFGETRRILRAYGPEVATPERKKYISFGSIAVDVLNVWLRPFLSKWHPRLQDHESRRPAALSASGAKRRSGRNTLDRTGLRGSPSCGRLRRFARDPCSSPSWSVDDHRQRCRSTMTRNMVPIIAT